MEIIAFSVETRENVVVIRNSTGQSVGSNNYAELLDFLLQPMPDTIKCFWGLDVGIAPVLRLLNRKICRGLAGPTHKVTFGDVDSDVAYELFYLPNKLLSIKKGFGGHTSRQQVSIYGLDGFFADDQPEPETALQMARLGNELLHGLQTYLGIVPHRLISPIGVFRDAGKLPSLPNINDTPDRFMESQMFAEECDNKEWVENFAVGHWSYGESFAYDLSCAYGGIAMYLADLREADYIYSREYVHGAHEGFLRGKVTLHDHVLVSPILTRIGESHLIGPVGSWKTYLTLDEVNFLERYELGTFELEGGWFIKFRFGAPVLGNLIQKLYELRTTAPPLMNHFLKRIPSGIVGLFHQHYPESGLGSYFNPIMHALVTSRTRLRVGTFIYQHELQNHVLRINTDGLTVDKKATLPTGGGPGWWRFISSDPVIILSPELVFTGSKHPLGLNYRLLRTMIVKHPRSTYYEARLRRRVTLFEALQDHDLSRLGEMTTRFSHIDLDYLAESQIRRFPKYPRTGEALIDNKYSSEPIRLEGKPRRKRA